MDYAKLIDGQIQFVSRKLAVGEYVVYNPTQEMFTEAGYKPISYTESLEVEPGYIAVSGWTETDEAIVQTWTIEPEGDIPHDEALAILLGGETA